VVISLSQHHRSRAPSVPLCGPDYTPKKMDTDTWEDDTNRGLLGITDVLLRAM
jgi:arabinosyltransferase B